MARLAPIGVIWGCWWSNCCCGCSGAGTRRVLADPPHSEAPDPTIAATLIGNPAVDELLTSGSSKSMLHRPANTSCGASLRTLAEAGGLPTGDDMLAASGEPPGVDGGPRCDVGGHRLTPPRSGGTGFDEGDAAGADSCLRRDSNEVALEALAGGCLVVRAVSPSGKLPGEDVLVLRGGPTELDVDERRVFGFLLPGANEMVLRVVAGNGAAVGEAWPASSSPRTSTLLRPATDVLVATGPPKVPGTASDTDRSVGLPGTKTVYGCCTACPVSEVTTATGTVGGSALSRGWMCRGSIGWMDPPSSLTSQQPTSELKSSSTAA